MLKSIVFPEVFFHVPRMCIAPPGVVFPFVTKTRLRPARGRTIFLSGFILAGNESVPTFQTFHYHITPLGPGRDDVIAVLVSAGKIGTLLGQTYLPGLRLCAPGPHVYSFSDICMSGNEFVLNTGLHLSLLN
ncbi:MAG: hypothetical protein A2161_07985 [Candidatus Schekmanbacteria bacterium RBG_13_48_7]|uniref:Uncharacterized protein n=1 Tax=Candidatus Schekmanbacteria bacterium RBG_13_48_7 TaxID=1817878 RepID=A0A1F7RP96_9BACT|nr:MAG: hypothetical protein A2161_07985 [Candidatus Schekmanbacteria bacterium RBG_13_48_7]